MSCYEMLEPFVRWAAQEQLINPNRYTLGFTMVTMDTDGVVEYTIGGVDTRVARFVSDPSKFAVGLRGAGRRYTSSASFNYVPLGEDLKPDTSQGGFSGVFDKRQSKRVLIHINATAESIQLRIGDVELREVVDEFELQCTDEFFFGIVAGKVHIVSLQMQEQTETGYRHVKDGEVEKPEVYTPPEPEAPPEPDDLQKIEGLGPKAAETLASLGIVTYAQLAKYNPTTLEADLKAAGLETIPGSCYSWPAQAALAGTGHWNGLRLIQEEMLKGGRVDLPDNFQSILGIGPATDAALHEMGIDSFKALGQAAANPEKLEADLRAAGVPIPHGTVSTWPQQIELASNYALNELEQLQRELTEMQEEMAEEDE
jgi:predicted flap endonuclease-1-like 5' DNA nuclease